MSRLSLRLCLAVALSQVLLASGYDKHTAKAREAAARGDLREAEREYQAALRDAKKHAAGRQEFLADEALSKIAERQYDLAAAEEYLRQGLAARRMLGTRPAAELPAWLDLESFYSRHERWRDGAVAADHIAGVWRDSGAASQAGMAQYLGAAGRFYHSAGDYVKAEERYRAALPILEAAMGESPALARVVVGLADTLGAEDKREEAEAAYQRALAMVKDTRWAVPARRDYRDFLRRHGRDDEAARLGAGPPGPTVGRAGARVIPPIPTFRPEPQYTDAARATGLMGTVLLYLEVDPSGLPVNIQVLEPLGLGLDERAVATVETWRFRPGTREGQPATVGATVEVAFRLL